MGERIWAIDWHGVFVPEYSLLEMVLRGTVMYLLVFVLVRIMSKRQLGAIGPSDVLVIVLLAEVAGNGFTADYRSVSEGAVLVMTLLGWAYALNWLGNKFPALERLIREPKLKLIENGRMLRRNMQAELVTTEELLAQLREKGLEDCEGVAAAYMEADGQISVIKKKR
ncbi:MAG: DUF421 domain-containing protein [Reyranella sp.]|uniref:DUF421 domain-containing protein n=1 Tax=Reyranella sp. TaxID=1929291 RepID=UPI00272FC929|nr:YetF domain-containing protein [Reyranella sp.]MDP1965694.1 DUF421 domain-containing protein [Reyranella sp.]MDP2373474.1 DUF421 domain-containing protein [Reyranella sp.]